MTYVFNRVDGGDIYKAYGDDLYKVADDLELPPGVYMVYSTPLMPDEITNRRVNLTFVMKYIRELRVPK